MNKIININNNNLFKLYFYRYSKKKYTIYENNKRTTNKELLEIEKVLNTKDKKKRLELIYDITCNYLDSLDILKICNFKDGECVVNRINKLRDCGCCKNNKGEVCKHLGDRGCLIRCPACKFYVCSYVKKKIKPKLRDIKAAKYFLSYREKFYLRFCFFEPKEVIINKMLNK